MTYHRIVQLFPNTCLHVLIQTMSVTSLLSFLVGFIFELCHLYLNIYWCPTLFPNQMMFVWLIVTRLVPLVEQEVPIRPEHPRLVGFWVVQSLVSCVVCRILCFWRHLYCVSLELRFLIIPLVSSNHSYVRNSLVFLFLHICDVLLWKSHLLVYKNYTMNIPSFSS
jgi:hypothetical protein